MRSSQPPPGDRFFARVLSAVFECPSCGYLAEFGSGRLQPKVAREYKRTVPESGWDPLRARWACPQCQLVFVLGLLAWPARAQGAPTDRPRDQIPGERELAQLRAQPLSLWMRERITERRPTHSNATAACTCQGKAFSAQRDKGCVLHGDHEEI